jgi:hypothetical protein
LGGGRELEREQPGHRTGYAGQDRKEGQDMKAGCNDFTTNNLVNGVIQMSCPKMLSYYWFKLNRAVLGVLYIYISFSQIGTIWSMKERRPECHKMSSQRCSIDYGFKLNCVVLGVIIHFESALINQNKNYRYQLMAIFSCQDPL